MLSQHTSWLSCEEWLRGCHDGHNASGSGSSQDPAEGRGVGGRGREVSIGVKAGRWKSVQASPLEHEANDVHTELLKPKKQEVATKASDLKVNSKSVT